MDVLVDAETNITETSVDINDAVKTVIGDMDCNDEKRKTKKKHKHKHRHNDSSHDEEHKKHHYKKKKDKKKVWFFRI